MDKKVLIIGAGPAGLTAAYELSKNGQECDILEASQAIGGISQTVNFEGNRFDIGGHRFFSKVEYVNELWDEILGDELLLRGRLSRIFYNNKYFEYPLKPLSALKKLGPSVAVLVGFSYLKALLFSSHNNEESFEDWVSNRFGHRLFNIFFKTYTEKVWGMECSEISADWASQRIKNLSLKEAVLSAFKNSNTKNGEVITSLIEEFKYPRLGPGMMWEKCSQILSENNCITYLNHKVTQIIWEDKKVYKIVTLSPNGEQKTIKCTDLVSSMPLREMIFALQPAPPRKVIEAAEGLRYRDYLTIVLLINRKEVFPDNWIYIHSPEVKLGRIQNYKNWSPEMVSDNEITTLGLEYFLWDKDEEWGWSEEKFIAFGIEECERLGIIKKSEVLKGKMVKMPKAYPVYDREYSQNLDIIKSFLNDFSNFQSIGRNGQHRYNNQDHSMMTGVYAARNVLGAKINIWNVNTELSYHETIDQERIIPSKLEKDNLDLLDELVTNLDPIALGLSVGIVCSSLLGLGSLILILKGGYNIGQNLLLLNSYLIGYSMTFEGILLAMLQLGCYTFIFGYVIASLRNLSNKLILHFIYKKVTTGLNQDLIDKI